MNHSEIFSFLCGSRNSHGFSVADPFGSHVHARSTHERKRLCDNVVTPYPVCPEDQFYADESESLG